MPALMNEKLNIIEEMKWIMILLIIDIYKFNALLNQHPEYSKNFLMTSNYNI